MASTLSWLDTCEHDRRQVLDVIDLFSVRDTRDELGMGGIRDAWADFLVPGTSTIQTRARYFFFIPWVYLREEQRGTSSEQIGRRARNAELNLVEAILESDPDSLPIGAIAGRGLKRLPSSIYWNGMRRFRLRLADGSLEQYHRTFDRNHSAYWNPSLPLPPDGFPDQADLNLRLEEARFLRDQVCQHAPHSLFAFLLREEQVWDAVNFPWEHPRVKAMPKGLQEWVGHAHCFSVAIHGSALLYNLMLAEKRNRDDWVEGYRDALESWQEDLQKMEPLLCEWDQAEFWRLTYAENERIPQRSRAFAEEWFGFSLGESFGLGLHEDSARQLVANRERFLKRNRSRLHCREHLERWGGRAGATRIDYRWGITQRLVRDVHEGLADA